MRAVMGFRVLLPAALVLLPAASPAAWGQESVASVVGAERVAALVLALSSPDWKEREDATAALLALGREAVPLLQEHLDKTEDAETAERLAHVLALLRFPELVGLWQGEIDSQPFTMIVFRQEGTHAVGANTCHWDAGALTATLESSNSGMEGVVYLDEPRELAGGGRYVCHLSDDGRRVAGTWTFHHGGQTFEWWAERKCTTATMDDLAAWLASDRIDTRCSAIYCAAMLPKSEALPLLEKALADPDPTVQREATLKLSEVRQGE
ncbi:MAG: HEAT repeat domain-containing protein [Planctomycetes bacterium]|nr:HEAT repeat domain-containing protein [Planctomycetota bacterium]